MYFHVHPPMKKVEMYTGNGKRIPQSMKKVEMYTGNGKRIPQFSIIIHVVYNFDTNFPHRL